MNNLIKCGYDFIIDDDKEFFYSIIEKQHISEMHVDVYLNDPYVLLSRMIIEESTISFSNGRLIVRDGDYTIFMNLITDEIHRYYIKKFDGQVYQVVFEVDEIWYKIVVIL